MKTTLFSELHMARDNENIGYDWSLIEDICEASGIDISEFRDENENNISALIHQWYSEHRARGGAPDPVMEDIIVEAKLETTFGSMGDNPGKS